MNLKVIEEVLDKNQKIAYTIIAFALLPWLGSFAITSYMAGEELPAYLKAASATLFSWDLVLIYFICAILMSMSLVVNTLIIVIGAFYLGFSSLLYLSPAYMLACTIGYFIGTRFKSDEIDDLLLNVDGLRELTERMKGTQLSTVSFAKMSPILPFVITNGLFGYLKFKFSTFFIGSFLGKWPRVLLFTFIGTSIKSLQQIYDKEFGKEWWVYVAGAALFAISFWGLYKTLNKKD
ncbi:MAG: VTT domain-containing protein [Cytophagales bacterium]